MNIERKNKIKAVIPEEYLIPTKDNYNILNKYNYNIKQLKTICKHYKIHQTGRKDIILERIKIYLKMTFFSIIIQKNYRKRIINKLNKAKGEGLFNRKICNNENDFLSFDDIINLNYYQFFSYKDIDGFIYGFDIVSLYNLILKNGKNAQNPYNRNKIPLHIVNTIRDVIRISNILKMPINIKLEKIKQTPEKNENARIVTLCQKMDELGNYTDVRWFNSLSRDKIVKFLYELNDIWQYRAQLSNDMKINICPPTGLPFRNININNLPNLDIKLLKNFFINTIDIFINSAQHREYNTLGAYYVLSALTLVNNEVANALPWLFESVAHT